MKQIKKVINWYIGRAYKFTDPVYKKFWRQSYFSMLIMVVIGGLILAVWDTRLPTGGEGFWQMVFIIVWVFCIGVGLGAAGTVESADRYQAKKEKKDGIPNV